MKRLLHRTQGRHVKRWIDNLQQKQDDMQKLKLKQVSVVHNAIMQAHGAIAKNAAVRLCVGSACWSQHQLIGCRGRSFASCLRVLGSGLWGCCTRMLTGDFICRDWYNLGKPDKPNFRLQMNGKIGRRLQKVCIRVTFIFPIFFRDLYMPLNLI